MESRTLFLVMLAVFLMIMVGVVAGLVFLGQEERGCTAYLAGKGQVEETYESVGAYLLTEFPPGMVREDVLEKLSQEYRHKLVEQAENGSVYVVFPGRLCDDQRLYASPSSCRYLIGYEFYFADGKLISISACDPPCEQW